MSNKNRNKRKAGKRNRKKSAYEKWIAHVKKNFAVYEQSNSQNLKQMMVTYTNSVPPRMPAPGGPTNGATFTMVQTVRGSDMTLPTGSAIVGALVRQSTASDVFAAWAFALADIPNISSVSALFDQYRIDEIQFRLRSRNNAMMVQNAASPNYATATPFVVVDRDDASAPTTVNELQQYDNCQSMAASDSIDIIFKPSITPSVFSGGAFSGYAVEDSSDYWLDSANTSIPHYGIKLAIPALVATTTQRFDWDVVAFYKVSFLNVR